MNFIKVLVLSLLLSSSSIICQDDNEHHDTDTPDHGDDSHQNDDFEPHEFDYDPHQSDSDYDEDVLTGTSHHDDKKTKDQAKFEINEIFQKADKNNDSKIERSELVSFVIGNLKKLHNESTNEEFIKVDKNQDNKISLDEYFLYHHSKTAKELENLNHTDHLSESPDFKKKIQHERERFKAADSDGDGFLNVHEYLLMKHPLFFPHLAHTVVHDYISDLDLDMDGMVDKSEYISHFHVPDHENKTKNEETLKKMKADFDQYDKDKNGKIDPEEYFAILKPGYEEQAVSEVNHLLKETDTDKDGSITLSEVEKNSHLWVGGESLDGEESDYSHRYDDEL